MADPKDQIPPIDDAVIVEDLPPISDGKPTDLLALREEEAQDIPETPPSDTQEELRPAEAPLEAKTGLSGELKKAQEAEEPLEQATPADDESEAKTGLSGELETAKKATAPLERATPADDEGETPSAELLDAVGSGGTRIVTDKNGKQRVLRVEGARMDAGDTFGMLIKFLLMLFGDNKADALHGLNTLFPQSEAENDPVIMARRERLKHAMDNPEEIKGKSVQQIAKEYFPADYERRILEANYGQINSLKPELDNLLGFIMQNESANSQVVFDYRFRLSKKGMAYEGDDDFTGFKPGETITGWEKIREVDGYENYKGPLVVPDPNVTPVGELIQFGKDYINVQKGWGLSNLNDRSSAAWELQWTYSTLEDLVEKGYLRETEILTPERQQLLAVARMTQTRGFVSFLNGDMTVDRFIDGTKDDPGLKFEWEILQRNNLRPQLEAILTDLQKAATDFRAERGADVTTGLIKESVVPAYNPNKP